MIFTKDNLRTYMRTQWEAQGETLEPNQRLGIGISESLSEKLLSPMSWL